MSNMTVKVEFLAGTTITDAVKEAIVKAVKWDVVFVEFKFNGSIVVVTRHSDAKDVVQEFLDGEYSI